MIYFVDDIVEIVTAKYKSWNDIPNHERGYFENGNESAPTIGQRFMVKHISIHDSTLYANIKGRLCLGTLPDCVRLYKRPFKNWIKYFLKKR